MTETSERPLKEIRMSRDNLNKEVEDWLKSSSKFFHTSCNEYILLLPHPKHKIIDGMSMDEFLSDCPENLGTIIIEIYIQRIKERENGNSWTTGIDLENDFGFVLVAFV